MKMAQQQSEDIVQFYTESGLDAEKNQLFKCEYCRQQSNVDFTVDYIRMISHLYIKHDKSEIMDNPEYKPLATSFNLQRQFYNEIDSGKCLLSNCGVTIKSKFGRALPFKNHLITHHADDKKNFFAKAVGIVAGRKILNNYEITDTEIVKCSFCRTTKPLTGLDSQPAKVLADLGKHLNSHDTYTLKVLQDEVPILEDEASIQIELEKEEKLQLKVNEKKQSIDDDLLMEETLRTISEITAEDRNTLLQQYNFKIKKPDKQRPIVECQIYKCGHQTKLINDKLYRIHNHWEIHHGPKHEIYNEVRYDRTIQRILQDYKITNRTLATCSECEFSTNLEEDTQLSLDNLQEMYQHYMDKHNVHQSHKKDKTENLQNKLKILREKRREAATQISHQTERPEQHSLSGDENVPVIPESSEIPSTTTQSSSIVEYRPRQSTSSDGGSVPMSSGVQSITTQSSPTWESSSKQRRLDSDSDDE